MFNRKLKQRIEKLERQIYNLEHSYENIQWRIDTAIQNHERVSTLSKLKPMSTVYVPSELYEAYFHERSGKYMPVKFVRLNPRNASALVMNEKEKFADVPLDWIYVEKPKD